MPNPPEPTAPRGEEQTAMTCPHGMAKPWDSWWGPCRLCEPSTRDEYRAAFYDALGRLAAQDTEIARLTEHNKNLLVEGALANAALVDFRAEIARLRAVIGKAVVDLQEPMLFADARRVRDDLTRAALTPPPPSEDDHA